MVKKKKVRKWIYWTPRILSLVFILFLSLFSLDVFDMHLGFLGTVLGLFMHNVPSLILLGAVLLSWKKNEIIGGITFIFAGVFYFLLIFISILRNSPEEMYEIIWTILISGPAIFIGVLFLVNWLNKRN